MSNFMMKNVYKMLPDWAGKKALKYKYLKLKSHALINEVKKLQISRSGEIELDDELLPFIRLSNGTFLVGQYPSEFETFLYSSYQDSLPRNIRPCAMRVAIDVVLRYMYPHGMPNLTPPYSRRIRHGFGFHPQHIETIDDIPHVSYQEKNNIKHIFMPKKGEFFLDIGAYMGYGTLRLSKEIGENGSIIAVETDPVASKILRLNIFENEARNVNLVNKAVWSRSDETLHLYRSDRQANSLIKSVVDSITVEQVKTATVDEILDVHHNGKVDAVSITINGAEVEAIKGMQNTFQNNQHMRLIVAGWYMHQDKRICDVIYPILEAENFRIRIGRKGGVIAWR
ncbi:MAG: FkbM family methyltransferase [Cyanobacteria bacterium P01_F01_bin.56]